MRLRHLVFIMSLTSISMAQELTAKRTMSHEEEVVRTTYADLSSAAQVGVLWHAVDRREGQSDLSIALSEAMDRQLRFELAEFKVGELRRVGNTSSMSLATGPVGILSAQYYEVPVNPVRGDPNASFNLIYADITLKTPTEIQKDTARPIPAHKVSTVKQFVHALRQPKSGGEWTRYASYSVVARLGERSISYRASFLFSGSDATEEILPLDYATAMNIAPFIKLQMCPPAVASTVFYESSEVQAWALAHQVCRCAKTHQKPVSSDRREHGLENAGKTRSDIDPRAFLTDKIIDFTISKQNTRMCETFCFPRALGLVAFRGVSLSGDCRNSTTASGASGVGCG